MNLKDTKPSNFIRQIIDEDIAQNRVGGDVITRFPPEPNGYLHIGHAKSICLNFGIAQDYNGKCSLRFDDTNPVKEDVEYIESIKRDVRWLGYDWGDRLYHASDYFDQLYAYALELINKNLAYVDSLDAQQIREYRGTLTEVGKDSPYRSRSAQENVDLFERMRGGEFKDGEHVLRAKIDMSSPNINMRDPIIYRIVHASHPMTADKWCIYPLYDFTHGQSDAIEGVTHSLCSLEFADHRPLYDWFIENLSVPSSPRQYEFSRLNLEYFVMSKRKLTQLVDNGLVESWDDPRMPTISGLRRRGYTPESVRDFCERVGVTKSSNTIEMSLLENSIRQDLENRSPRALAVLNPLKLVIENYPEDKVEEFEVPNHPNDPSFGSRLVPFSREIYIEHDDFMEDPPKKFFRLGPGREVRLKYAYYVTCNEVIKNEEGDVIELRCSYDPQSRGGGTPDNRKIKGTLHWVCAKHAVNAQIRNYDRLFNQPNPDGNKEKPFTDFINPESLVIQANAKIEPSLANPENETRYQFERLGYFYPDSVHHTAQQPVYNKVVGLRDSWAKKK